MTASAPRRPPLRPALGRSLSGPLRPVVSLGFVLAIWSAVSLAGLVNEALFPAPWTVVSAFIEMTRQGVLWEDLRVSLGRAAIGFFIGAGLGVAAGMSDADD